MDYVDEDDADEPPALPPSPSNATKRKREGGDDAPPRKFRVRAVDDRPAPPAAGVRASVDVIDGPSGSGLRLAADARAAAPPRTDAEAPAAAAPRRFDRAAFDASRVSPVEKACCPEWFCGDPRKTPEKYVEARAWMMAQQKPGVYLAATVCRQRCSVDAAAALRIWRVLDAAGLVNADVPAARRRVPRAPLFAPSSDAPAPDAFWTRDRVAALVAAARVGDGDWERAAAAVSALGEAADAGACAAKFAALDLAELRGASSSPPAARAAPPSRAPAAFDDGRAALDALVSTRLARLEDRVARLSDLERQLADEEAAQSVERARVERAWADVALNLEE